MDENLFKVLVTQRQWVYEAFRSQFEQAARLLADEEQDSRLRSLSVGERTYRRWLAGGVKTLPQPALGRDPGSPADAAQGERPCCRRQRTRHRRSGSRDRPEGTAGDGGASRD